MKSKTKSEQKQQKDSRPCYYKKSVWQGLLLLWQLQADLVVSCKIKIEY